MSYEIVWCDVMWCDMKQSEKVWDTPLPSPPFTFFHVYYRDKQSYSIWRSEHVHVSPTRTSRWLMQRSTALCRWTVEVMWCVKYLFKRSSYLIFDILYKVSHTEENEEGKHLAYTHLSFSFYLFLFCSLLFSFIPSPFLFLQILSLLHVFIFLIFSLPLSP